MLLEHRTVAENIFIGRYPKNRYGMVDYKKMRDEALRISQSFSWIWIGCHSR